MVKILLDTDIGSDIDDAVCLAYLLAHPACELLGITTVTGQPVVRARMASALCRVVGKAIPIFPGSEHPLLSTIRQPEVPQAAALDRWPHRANFPVSQAVEFLRTTIRKHPGEITLLAIGAMTNVALLFATDPEIPSLLKELVLMCGVFTNRLSGVGPLEWNAIGDPYATAMVYRTPVRVHRSIGLDVTCQVRMDAQEVRDRFRSPLLRPVLDWAEVWFRRTDRITFHDPLAAAIIFDDAICGFERGEVSVELASERLHGATHWTPASAGPHEIALRVDAGRFFDDFFSRV